jgi:hypothetical protein
MEIPSALSALRSPDKAAAPLLARKFYGEQGRERVQEQAMSDAMNLLIEVIEKPENRSQSERPSASA